MESKDNHHDQRYAINEIASAATNMNLLQILFFGPQLADAILHPSLTQSEWISLKSNPILHQKKTMPVQKKLFSGQRSSAGFVKCTTDLHKSSSHWIKHKSMFRNLTVFSSYDTCLFLFQQGPCQIYVYTRMCGTSCHVECWFPCEGTAQIQQICSLHSQYNLPLFVTLGYFCGKIRVLKTCNLGLPRKHNEKHTDRKQYQFSPPSKVVHSRRGHLAFLSIAKDSFLPKVVTFWPPSMWYIRILPGQVATSK